MSTLPSDAPQTGSCAEIEVHPVFSVGGTPRNFKIDPTGNYLFAAGQNTGVTVMFTIDRPTGIADEDRRHARSTGARLPRVV